MAASGVDAANGPVGPSVLVVAHPDDEVLWFSSVLRSVDLIVFCFEENRSRPDWSEGRRRVLADYPLPRIESLRLPEAEVFNGADWRRPQCTPYGLAVARKADSSAAFSEETYRANFDRLRRALAKMLERGYTSVYTHNPWGEYGHEEHVQVYRAVKALQPALGFELWFDNYCSNKSHELMLRHVDGFHSDYSTAPTDARLGEELKRLYQRHGCWTWFDDYVWFTHECQQRDRDTARGDSRRAGHFFPLNYLRVEAPWEVEQPPRWRRMAGRLRRFLPATGTSAPGARRS